MSGSRRGTPAPPRGLRDSFLSVFRLIRRRRHPKQDCRLFDDDDDNDDNDDDDNDDDDGECVVARGRVGWKGGAIFCPKEWQRFHPNQLLSSNSKGHL